MIEPSSTKELPRIPTPEMLGKAWDMLRDHTTGIGKLGPGIGVKELWQAMFDAYEGETK